MPRKLKVFRTTTGFHDAYVAAPSRKAALEAWGAEADLFARGVAEEVTDAKLMAEPLARPGEVVRLSRGDLAAQLKALGPRKKPEAEKTEPAAPSKRTRKAKPPPRRDKIDAAEDALREAEQRHRLEREELEARLAAIEQELEALRAKQAKETDRLSRAREKARDSYRQALERWQAGEES